MYASRQLARAVVRRPAAPPTRQFRSSRPAKGGGGGGPPPPTYLRTQAPKNRLHEEHERAAAPPPKTPSARRSTFDTPAGSSGTTASPPRPASTSTRRTSRRVRLLSRRAAPDAPSRAGVGLQWWFGGFGFFCTLATLISFYSPKGCNKVVRRRRAASRPDGRADRPAPPFADAAHGPHRAHGPDEGRGVRRPRRRPTRPRGTPPRLLLTLSRPRG